ncbi:MAG: hypothetical protein KOO63_14460, partial [Bacteroidales bacterium]|nr:hypothetical protein [Candidatus Latescibacterota bacterium]
YSLIPYPFDLFENKWWALLGSRVCVLVRSHHDIVVESGSQTSNQPASMGSPRRSIGSGGGGWVSVSFRIIVLELSEL